MSSFHWKIPQFPVICLEFNVVTFMKCMELHEGVVQTCDLPNISIGEFRCTSSCDIDVNGKMYKVLWKLHKKSEATFDIVVFKNILRRVLLTTLSVAMNILLPMMKKRQPPIACNLKC